MFPRACVCVCVCVCVWCVCVCARARARACIYMNEQCKEGFPVTSGNVPLTVRIELTSVAAIGTRVNELRREEKKKKKKKKKKEKKKKKKKK